MNEELMKAIENLTKEVLDLKKEIPNIQKNVVGDLTEHLLEAIECQMIRVNDVQKEYNEEITQKIARLYEDNKSHNLLQDKILDKHTKQINELYDSIPTAHFIQKHGWKIMIAFAGIAVTIAYFLGGIMS